MQYLIKHELKFKPRRDHGSMFGALRVRHSRRTPRALRAHRLHGVSQRQFFTGSNGRTSTPRMGRAVGPENKDRRAGFFAPDPTLVSLLKRWARALSPAGARRAHRATCRLPDAWISERTGHLRGDDRTLHTGRSDTCQVPIRAVPRRQHGDAGARIIGPGVGPSGRSTPPILRPRLLRCGNRPNSETSGLVGASGFEPPTPRPPV
jgi:hypothetical protein